MKNNNYKRELEIAQQLAVEAGKAILPIYYGVMDVSVKEDSTPVTNADVLANRIIQDGILQAFPLDGIVSEELETVKGKNRCWYIDPIDGTRGFIEHNNQFAVHIGLAVEEKAVLGVVYKPVAKEMYYAVRGQGAFRSSDYGKSSFPEMIGVQEHRNLTASMHSRDIKSENYSTLEKSLPIKQVILTGSEGLRIIKVAEGIADLHFTVDTSCSTWDVCAPQAIAEEAGAHVRYTSGKPIIYHGQRKLGRDFVVANSISLAERISELLEKN